MKLLKQQIQRGSLNRSPPTVVARVKSAAPLPNLVDIASLPAFATTFAAYCRYHATQINELATEVGEILVHSHRSLIDSMKSALGADAANEVADGSIEQERAFGAVEDWVSEELSAAGIHADVAMALWLRGPTDGATWLAEHKYQSVKRESSVP
jgi:hypothetical protein